MAFSQCGYYTPSKGDQVATGYGLSCALKSASENSGRSEEMTRGIRGMAFSYRTLLPSSASTAPPSSSMMSDGIAVSYPWKWRITIAPRAPSATRIWAYAADLLSLVSSVNPAR